MRTWRSTDSFPWFVVMTTGLLVLGFLCAALWPTHFANAVQPALDKLRNLANHSGGTAWSRWVVICVNNLFAAIVMVLSGILFGVLPAVSMWLNGCTLGYVTVVGATSMHAAPWKLFVLGVLPHGLFEMPAIIWSSALGIQLGYCVLQTMVYAIRSAFTSGTVRGTRPSFRNELRRLRRHVPYIVGLLVIAAAVESTVTPKLLQWGLGM